MNYWIRRIPNLILQVVTLRRYFYRYSIYYCRECTKLVSSTHTHRKKFINHKTFTFGLKLTKPRPEQFIYHPKLATLKKKLPTKVDYRPVLVKGGFKTRCQTVGSCTGETGATDKDYQEIKQGDWPGQFSASYLYYEERKLHGWENEDSGANMKDIGVVLIKGCATRKTMPETSNYRKAPTREAYNEASNWPADETQSRLHYDDLKVALVEKGPVRFGVPIPKSFFDSAYGGWVPCEYDSIQGYHAMLCVGFDDNMKSPAGEVGHFIVLQSWGLYGDVTSGVSTVYIPYRWMQHYEGMNDNWVQLDYPEPLPECNEGAVEILEYCPDGVTWKKRKICVNGKWQEQTQTCPSIPIIDEITFEVRVTFDKGKTWITLYSQTIKAKLFKDK